jgi:oligosaccharide repeat unit polymerase
MAAYLTNPLSLFLSVWTVATLCYIAGIGSGLFRQPDAKMLAVMAANVVFFTLGYSTLAVFRRLPGQEKSSPRPSAPLLTRERLKTALALACLSGLCAFALCLYRLSKIWPDATVSISNFLAAPSLIRNRLIEFLAASIYQTQKSSVLISLANSVFSIGFVLLALYLYRTKSVLKYSWVLLYLLVAAATSAINLSRKELVVNVLCLVFAYLFIHSVYRQKKARAVVCDLFAAFAITGAVFVVIDILLQKSQTYGYQSRPVGFLFSIYWYVASPLAALNEFVADHHSSYCYGENMFLSVYKWIYRLGFAGPPRLTVYAEKLYIPYVANVYTYLRNIYADFGITGVTLVTYSLGWGTCALRRPARHNLAALNLYVILLVFIFFSFYNYLFISNQFYLQALFGLLLFRFDITYPRQPDPIAAK